MGKNDNWIIIAFFIFLGIVFLCMAMESQAVNTYENVHKPHDKEWLSQMHGTKQRLLVFSQSVCVSQTGKNIKKVFPELKKIDDDMNYHLCWTDLQEVCR